MDSKELRIFRGARIGTFQFTAESFSVPDYVPDDIAHPPTTTPQEKDQEYWRRCGLESQQLVVIRTLGEFGCRPVYVGGSSEDSFDEALYAQPPVRASRAREIGKVIGDRLDALSLLFQNKTDRPIFDQFTPTE